jgi:putative ABC transport system permease protein
VVTSFGAWSFSYIKPVVLMLLGGVLCVWLIACTNVAGLWLVRSFGRQKEIGLRTALGAGRGRIVRQFLAEGVLMGMLGGGLGILVASWGTASLPRLLARGGDARFLTWATHLDMRMFLFSLLLSVMTGALSALIPAVTVSSPNLNQVLKEGARSLLGLPRNRIRHGFVISQIALSLMLLVISGLFLKSVVGLLRVPLGYKPESAVSMNISLPTSKYPDEPARALFFQQVFEHLSALPGIESVGAATTMPMGFSYTSQAIVEGRMDEPEGGYPSHYDVVRGQYFQTLGIPIRSGRDLTKADYTANAGPVCLINEALARHLFAGEQAIGHRLRLTNTVYEIVGIVGNTRHDSLLDANNPDGRIYLSLPGRLPVDTRWIFVRSNRTPTSLSRSIGIEIQRIDPDQPVGEFGTLQEDILNRTANQRLVLKLLGFFAGLAVLLASMGLYGVIASEVTQRTGEFGVRLALGAQRADVMGLVLKKGMLLSVLGIMLGIAGALAVERAIRSQLFQAKASDPVVVASAVFAFLFIALVACWMPARRATKVDPMTALRCE